jgi:putative drug exporter of the RND superfamily
VVAPAIAFPLSTKLTGAEKNNASAGLPAGAESTEVVDLQSRFQLPNIFPAVVVYRRASGLTTADRAKAAADARRFATLPGVGPGQVAGPVPSADGKAIQTILQVNLGEKGWDGAGDGRRPHPRDHPVACGRPGLAHHRPAGDRGRQQ